jgi:hypothetical protein
MATRSPKPPAGGQPHGVPAARGATRGMGRSGVVALYVALLVAVIVGLDVLLFRGRPLARLLVNAGTVLVFAGLYLRFFGRA